VAVSLRIQKSQRAGPRPLYTANRYMQVNLTVTKRDDFLEVVQWLLYTGWPFYTESLYTVLIVITNNEFPIVNYAIIFEDNLLRCRFWDVTPLSQIGCEGDLFEDGW